MRGNAAGYGVTAKVFHWLIFLLLAAQYAVGSIMPHNPLYSGRSRSFHVLGIGMPRLPSTSVFTPMTTLEELMAHQ